MAAILTVGHNCNITITAFFCSLLYNARFLVVYICTQFFFFFFFALYIGWYKCADRNSRSIAGNGTSLDLGCTCTVVLCGFPTTFHFCRLLQLWNPGLPVNAVLNQRNFDLASLSDDSATSSSGIYVKTQISTICVSCNN